MSSEHIREVLTRVMSKLEDRMANPSDVAGVPSGIEGLDYYTDGFQKEFYILGARTSMGKSALAKDIILAGAEAGHHMHLINIEDSNVNTVTRQLSAATGVELWKIQKGKVGQGELGRMYAKITDLSRLHITFEDSAYDIKAVSASLKNAHEVGANMVIVDYLQLMKGEGHKRRLEQLQDISQLLKQFSKKIPILAVVQINRNVEQRKERRPNMSDIRECGDIEQDADVIMLLYRESYYTKDDTDHSAELTIAKGRNCGTGMIKLHFDELRATFRESYL